MLFHPIFRLIATRPELLAEHAGAYAELAAAQGRDVAIGWRDKVLYAVLTGVFALIGVMLLGVALLLWAALPDSALARPALLLIVPLVPLAAAAGCWVVMRRKPNAPNFALLREQFAQDAQMWREPRKA